MQVRAVDVVDVFTYLVVLGVFIQLFPSVIAESFLVALLTALLLKLVLEVVLRVKKLFLSRFRAADSTRTRITGALTLLLVLPASKYVVLGAVDLVFGDAVSLGGFLSVTALIFVLTLTRAAVRWWFDRHAGTDDAPGASG